MAQYVFICPKCETETVIVSGINDATPEPACETCEVKLERKFGIQTIRFMGSGWGKDKN